MIQVLMMRKVLVKVKVMQQNVMMLKPLLLVHPITIVVRLTCQGIRQGAIHRAEQGHQGLMIRERSNILQESNDRKDNQTYQHELFLDVIVADQTSLTSR